MLSFCEAATFSDTGSAMTKGISHNLKEDILKRYTLNMHLSTDPDTHPSVQPAEAADAQEGSGKQPLGVFHCHPSWWGTLPCRRI